jgi:hypothetical protein
MKVGIRKAVATAGLFFGIKINNFLFFKKILIRYLSKFLF